MSANTFVRFCLAASMLASIASCGGSDGGNGGGNPGPTDPNAGATRIQILPRTDTTRNHAVGDTVHLSVTGKDVSSGTPVTWTSLDTTATVSTSGDLIVRSSGTARIVASTGSVADTVAFALKVTLPRFRIVSINGVALAAAGPNAVADSFNVNIEVRNPPGGYVVGTVFFVANTPARRDLSTTPTSPNIQPGETRSIVVRSHYTPPGSYTARIEATVGPSFISTPYVPLIVTNSDVIPPRLMSLAPANDTTWKAGTPLKITLNVVDLESGVDGYTTRTTWAAAQPAACVGNSSGGVDGYTTFTGIPVILDFPGCVVPLGVNTVTITGVNRAGNTTTRTLTITGI